MRFFWEHRRASGTCIAAHTPELTCAAALHWFSSFLAVSRGGVPSVCPGDDHQSGRAALRCELSAARLVKVTGAGPQAGLPAATSAPSVTRPRCYMLTLSGANNCYKAVIVRRLTSRAATRIVEASEDGTGPVPGCVQRSEVQRLGLGTAPGCGVLLPRIAHTGR